MDKSLVEKMQDEIQSKMEGIFESVIEEKNEYYQNNPLKIPEKSSIDSMISNSALANSAISGSASLIPGPWGMLAVVPELVLVIRNQIGLIYEIAAANGKRDMMTKDLAATIFLSGMGTTVGSLVIVHGGKYLIRRASLQVFQKMIVLLGGKITQQALKSAVSKWFPGIGAAAMAAWSNYMTRKIGNRANEIFSGELEIEDSIKDIELVSGEDFQAVEDDVNKSIDFYKAQIIINLAKIDRKIAAEEAGFIDRLIDESNITQEERVELIKSIKSKDRKLGGVSAISSSRDDAIMLMADLTAIAKIDGACHVTEKLYIKQIGALLNFTESDIEEIIAS